ncbi:eCIS core domain-containing protein [Fodinibius salsisoli]|uniref:DUF4157 domain-containing protein n=1 Tax=Fodinibius salsisoli TaxID=2820877 RepID=A0ABT3PQM0_9BACT|nr:DUF4157 domain-containing protein [Fodinibius salsisoli]MCW9708168.1 DUF4157 domain-containing protein [Fodinibius salsisoli]
MLSVSHKSSSDSDSKSAANVHRKAANQHDEAKIQTKREARNDHTASLQRVIQNGNTGGISAIQAKLSVGQPDDKYEVEAESKADRVMSMAQPGSESVQSKPIVGTISRMIQTQAEEEEELQMQPMEEEEIQAKSMEEEPELQAKELEEENIQRQAGEEEEIQAKSQEEEPEVQAREMEEEELQRKGDSESASSRPGSSFESSLSAIKGAGDPLPGSVRSYMEPRFGADFSNVRVHTGGEAADLSQNINAQAFTHGRDIYFNEGKYNPDSSSGKHLIAHELTHTIQQGAAVQTKGKATQTSSNNNRVQRSWLSDAASWVGDRVSDAAEWVGDSLEAGKDWLMGWIRDHIADVRGYRLFTVALGQDPITGEHVDRNGRNFIEAGLDIIPNGAEYKRKLEREGALTEAAAWVDEQIVLLQELNPTRIAGNFSRFWDRLSITDIRNPRSTLEDLLRIFSTPINAVIQFARNAASKFLEIVKSYVKTEVKDYIKDQQSPTFYPLLRVILAEDPITGEEVERSGANILRGFIRLHPDGDEQLAQMEETGSFQRAANWVNRSIIRIRNIATGLKTAFLSIWEAITDINTLLHPIATFRRIYNNFRAPLTQLADFMWEVGSRILKFIKDALLSRLSAFARNTRGYPLITVLLGKDPFTGRQVERNVENIVRGFMSLMEGGEEKFEKMKETGAIARLNSWLEGALARLNITWEYIRGLFMSAWRSFSIHDIAQPFEAFARIVRLFSPPIRRLFNFVVEVIKKIIEIVLQIMNFPSDLIASIFQKTVSVIQQIKRDPIGFIKNLMLGVKQGFIQFFDRIGTHLMNGVTGWLFGELEEAGITPPRELTFRSILGLVMDVLGITADRIFEKIGERIGRERMERLRGMIDRVQGIWSFVRDVMERGPVAIWERVQEQLSNLWDMVLDRIKSWIMERIINRVTAKLLTMLDPTGIMAVVNGFIAFYNAVQSFVRYFREMLETVNRFVDGVRAIASGNVNPAANKLEEALGNAMPIAIGFLANQVGLGGLGRRIGEMIEAVQERVDQAIDWLIDRAIQMGGAVLNAARSAAGTVRDTVANLFGGRTRFRTESGESHSLYVEEGNNRPRLMMASTPRTVEEFLDFYESETSGSDTKRGHWEAAKEILDENVKPLIEELDIISQQDDADEDTIRAKQQELLSAEVELADRLRLLLRTDEDIGGMAEKYALEGITGTYGTMPKPSGDDLTADHQPQAAIFEEAARMRWFRVEGANRMRERAANRADSAYAINLHKYRHEEGRTYGSKGSATKSNFLADVGNTTSEEKTPKENRVEVVNVIENHLELDVEAMKTIVSKDYSHNNWRDIYQETSLPEEEKKELIDDVKSRIENGENRLKSQNLDTLADRSVDSPLSTASNVEMDGNGVTQPRRLVRLSINNPGSDAEEALMKLPGIGSARADQIMANIPFQSWAEVTEIPGITQGMINNWQSQTNENGDRLVYFYGETEWN